MAQPVNAMQVFSLLDKSNCRKCGEKTCLAFASAVFLGRRNIGECPLLDIRTLDRFTEQGTHEHQGSEADNALDSLRARIATADLHQAAQRIGGRFDGDRLTVRILGKNFAVDTTGKLFSDIHIIPWVARPFLTYVLECDGTQLSGEWVSYRELHGAAQRYPLFRKRCEEPMRHLADVYAELFDDMVHLFQGEQVENRFESDISVILPVFPLVPLLICYWKADEGMSSSLHLFFDRSANDNLGHDEVFTIATGLSRMFEKLAIRHGRQPISKR